MLAPTTMSTQPGLESQAAQQYHHEALLIARVRKGGSEFFPDLIRPYQRQVYKTALSIVRNEADAEEVAQEVLLRVFLPLGPVSWRVQVRHVALQNHRK